MAIVRKGVLNVVTGGVAQVSPLGFVPNYFMMENKTKIIANTNGIQKVEWWDDMVNGSAYVSTMTAGAPVLSYLATNGISPFITAGSALYPPSNLIITGISQAANAVVTAVNAFTAKDVGVTVVSFHNVVGMTQINTLSGVVQSIVPGVSFTVNINTSGFSAYVSGGIANIVTGIPALQGGDPSSGNAPGFPPSPAATFQVLNTPLFNAGVEGLLLGLGVMTTTADVWQYLALLDASFTSD